MWVHGSQSSQVVDPLNKTTYQQLEAKNESFQDLKNMTVECGSLLVALREYGHPTLVAPIHFKSRRYLQTTIIFYAIFYLKLLSPR
jgi:hypothetical protein